MPNSATPALAVQVTSSDLRQLYVDLKNVEGNLRVELRKGVTAAAKPVVDAVKAGSGWSTRIPGAVKAKTSFSAKAAGVSITVDANKAPGARALEHAGNPGQFRHPVFGNRESWVSQPARPFFWHGIAAADSRIDQAMQNVMDTVIREAGFR